MAHEVFVSYSSKDKIVADTIVSTLEKNNIRCWYAPRDIEPGADWGKSITNAIKDSKVFLLIFSGNSNKSQRVLDELNFAISQEETIVPFRIENLEPSDAMLLHLISRHWLDAYNPSWEKFLNKLVKTLSANLVEPDAEDELITPEPKEERRKKNAWLGILLKGSIIGAIILFLGWFGLSRLNVFNSGNKIPPTLNIITPTSSLATPTSINGPESIATDTGGTLDISFTSDSIDLDPINAYEMEPGILAENTFLKLTDLDTSQRRIVPEAAESWSVSTDGRIYTFKIRPEIPWVTHPTGGETEVETDDNGEIRYLTAKDFVYTILQICEPNTSIGMSFLFVPLIKGCQALKDYADPKNIPSQLFDDIGAKAISEYELIIELNDPAAFFLTLTSNNVITAVPSWAIEKYGVAWKNPGIIPTNGYYVIDEFKLGESIHLARNKFLPQDLLVNGNIDFINIRIGVDEKKAYDLWLNSLIDFAPIPKDQITNHFENYPDEILEVSGQSIYFFIFNNQKPPFNDVHVRRAFAAAFDNITYVNDVQAGEGKPMTHFGLPGIVGAPPIDEIGVGYDPEFARSELLAAGYPNCDGFTKVKFSNSSDPAKFIPDEFIRSWEQALGCPENTIITTHGENSWDESADIYDGGWTIDFPDLNNIFHEVLFCNRTFLKRPFYIRDCNVIDDLIIQAQEEVNPERRSALYYQIEGDFFGTQGEFPLAPIYMGIHSYAVHSWINPIIDFVYNTGFNEWKIDINAKNSAIANK